MRRRTIALGVLAAAAGGLLVGRPGLGEDVDWEDAEKPGRIVDVDGYGVHCVVEGDGPAIVLVHGFGGSTWTFREVIPLLARHHRADRG